MARRKSKKALSREVEQAYHAGCSGIEINIMDIGKVFAHGAQAQAEGAEGEALVTSIRGFVDTIRKN